MTLQWLDAVAIRAWRSDTLRACAISDKFQDRLNRRCEDTAVEVLKVLLYAGFSQGGVSVMCRKFLEKIALPTAEFSTKLRCSTNDYQWSWPCLSSTITKSDLRAHDIIDSKTHRRDTIDKFFHLPDDAVIGDYIMAIFPALYRVEGNNQHDILVSKGTLLVKACEESLPPLKKLNLAWSADSRDQSPSIKPEPDNMTQNRSMQNIPWTSNHAGSSQKFQKRAAGDGNVKLSSPSSTPADLKLFAISSG